MTFSRISTRNPVVEAEHSNSRASAPGVRPVRTSSTIRHRYSGARSLPRRLALAAAAAAGDVRDTRRAYVERSIEGWTRHREIVARFGRFPHRNAVLGPDSTTDEPAHLAVDGESFGQGLPAADAMVR